MKFNKIYFVLFAVLVSTVFLCPNKGQATEYRSPDIKIFSSDTNNLESSFLAYDSSFKGGAAVALGDLDADGKKEIIVAPGPGGGPHVKIFDSEGNYKNGFFAYDKSYSKGVNIASGDLNGDGKDEIITATRFGATPHVRVFDGMGNPKFTMGFFAYQETFRGGVNITTCDINGDGSDEIVTGAGIGGGPHVRIFKSDGSYTGVDYFPYSSSYRGGVNVACGNVDGGPESELIFGVQSSDEAWIKVYKTDAKKTVLGMFRSFPKEFKKGTNITTADVDQDGLDEIVASANTGGGPHIRFFEAHGYAYTDSIFAYEGEFRGGVYVAAGDINNDSIDEIITSPSRRSTEGRTDIDKYIEVDISDQVLKYYENGYLVDTAIVSTGKWSMPTPIGSFKIQNKNVKAYSNKYGLYMPYWMQFDARGYGLHELPEWPNGYKEGQDHLGVRVSHGCVRLGVGPAGKLFNWAEVGTTVIIRN